MGEKLLSVKLALLAVLFVTGFGFLLVYFTISMTMLYKTALENEQNSARTIDTMRISREIGNASDYLTLQAQNYALSGNKEYYDNYWREVKETKTRDKAIQKLIEIGIPKDILSLADEAKKASDILIKTEEAAFEEVKKGNLGAATQLMYSKNYEDGKNLVNSHLENFTQKATAYSNGLALDSRSRLNFFILQCWIVITSLSIIFAIFISIFLKHLVSALSKMQKMFEKIADGDMRVKAPVMKGDSEIYSLFHSMNIFILNINNILKNVISSSEEVASGNNQLAATMEELSTTFNGQAQQVKENADNMSSLLATTKNTVERLDENSNIINTTVERATDGKKQLNNLKKGMENIHSQTNSLSETINKLAESSVEIGNIITVINDIADQTNLLALNAAIEAARAGEMGRGFAVVADEVRKLAERTTKATGEISTIISSLQYESEAASKEMQNAASKVKDGVTNIEKTEVVFNDIFTGIDGVKTNTGIISSDVSEEYRIIENVSTNTKAVSSGIDESNGAVSEVTKTVAHLQERVNNLKTMVARFKVD